MQINLPVGYDRLVDDPEELELVEDELVGSMRDDSVSYNIELHSCRQLELKLG